ncbi:ParA family protein [Variovorax guangxiensis]|uniref:ParA family protein n=1 Tax=Variovorax guangxiensis TaxID=1775474 RepID=A0A3S0ZJW3_9BURK|nr:ParA family protein [Variovorax guangxiensis]RUR71858.1 ParA family protein [Variovorax guangxiensis]
MKTLVLANQKGGVGKSAIGCQYAYYLAQQGQRVLFIDLDHQMNSSKALAKNSKVTSAELTSSALLAGQLDALPDAPFVLVPGDDVLSGLERQPGEHNNYVNALKAFLEKVDGQFDACIIDTNPNPDIRYAAALITGQFLLSPIELNQEAIDGIGGLLNHKRYGYRKIKAAINTQLDLIGILPNLVEPTPFQKGNFKQLVEHFSQLLIVIDPEKKRFAFIPTRTAIAEAQAEGAYLADMKKTSARDAWREIKPSFEAIAKRMALEV